MGLVNYCVPDDRLDAEVTKLCATILQNSSFSHRGTKQLLCETDGLPLAAGLAHEIYRTPGVGPDMQQRIEAFPYGTSEFDLVVSRLALHYVADVRPLFARVARALVDDGRFVFSLEHPVITSCSRGWKEGTVRQDWLVDGYFDAGPRAISWLGGEVQKYHRTVEDYFEAMRAAGFSVEHLREARPRAEMFTTAETYERRKRIPLFLLIAARRV